MPDHYGACRRCSIKGNTRIPFTGRWQPPRSVAAAGSGVAKQSQPAQQTQQRGDSAMMLAGWLREKLSIENQTELITVLDIATNINSLEGMRNGRSINALARPLTVAELEAVAAALLALGLGRPQVSAVVRRWPTVLCYDTQRLTAVAEYLQRGLGLSQQQLLEVLEARPSVLGLELQQLQRLTGYLIEAEGRPLEEVVQLLKTSL